MDKTVNQSIVNTVKKLVFFLLLSCGDVRSLAPLQHPKHERLQNSNVKSQDMSRRLWFTDMVQVMGSWALVNLFGPEVASATDDDDDNFFQDPEIKELYENPSIPEAPEERSGLVVLRVAEVAQFQEKILRSIASGELQGVQVAPMQFSFGTQILLRNSNLDGNMKLMINQEIPRNKRKDAIVNAVAAMNTLQEIAKFSGSIQRDFETIEMVELADMYRDVRVNLNQLYEYLPKTEKDKYYGYFIAVTDYEKKVAEGTYNPDLDGILKFD